MSATEHTGAREERVDVDGVSVFVRRAAARGVTPLYVHGVPDSADVWTPFLRRGGGIAPDLPGFGRSDKPAEWPYSIDGYAEAIERLLAALGVERVSLVVHDWGAVGLAFAQRHPERVERLVVVNGLPLLPGYRWHRIARVWRTRGLGELAMGATTRLTLRTALRKANATPGSLPGEAVDAIWRHFDQGTQRAILRLYRSAPETALAAAGADLDRVRAPALVLWGDRDPYIPAAFADAYGRALGDARVEHVADAGHWPWLDRPELVDRIADCATGAGR